MGESQEKLYKRVREIIKSKINCIENYLSNFLFRRAEHSKTGDNTRSEQSSLRPRLPRLPSSSRHLPTLQGQIWRPRCGQVSYMWPTHDVYVTCHVPRALGSKLSVTIVEEFSRKSRDARQELRRYMREVRKNSPEKLCRIHYDKLLVDDKVFIFRRVFLNWMLSVLYLSVCIISEGKIIEEAKKKNDGNCLRCDTALSGQVEEVDKVRYCSYSTYNFHLCLHM